MEIQKKAVNSLRILGAETVSHAKSGHSGIVLGAAPIMYAVYRAMNIDGANPTWFNRDRFVLSAGHGSALLYAALCLFGFPVALSELKDFRKLGGRLHGHPEVDQTMGVECSTGPLGQGIANAVGLALAEKRLAHTYNRAGFPIIDHYTFCLVGDGCLMEGISYEAANLAGLWKLNKLIVLYDSNDITLDGTRESADGEDVTARFKAAGWNVIRVNDGNDEGAILSSIERAKKSQDKPTLVEVKTKIGFGAGTQGTAKAHGQVLEMDEISKLKKQWGIKSDTFELDKDVEEHYKNLASGKKDMVSRWENLLEEYKKKHEKEYEDLELFFAPIGNEDVATKRVLKSYNIKAEGKTMALRDAGHLALQQLHRQEPRLWGGNADISSTTKAFIQGGTTFSHDRQGGEDIAFGVREHAMAAIINGLALHGFLPYCSTFLAFSDYARPSIRLSALMNLPVHYIFSHDGIGHAQDGPTHQATEHLASLRLIPNLEVFRPCDDVETCAVYKYIYEKQIPATTVLSRGGTALISEQAGKSGLINSAEKWKREMDTGRGAYQLCTVGEPIVTILATGTEVSLAVSAMVEVFTQYGIGSRLVSMPSMTLFEKQTKTYKDEVLGTLPIVAIELGNGEGWHKYINSTRGGEIIAFDKFGHSGAERAVLEKLGFTVSAVVGAIKTLVG